MGQPGAEASMSNAVGKADRTGYHLKALQEIRNSLRPFATENGSSLPAVQKDGSVSYHPHLYQYPTPGSYSEVPFLSFYLAIADSVLPIPITGPLHLVVLRYI